MKHLCGSFFQFWHFINRCWQRFFPRFLVGLRCWTCIHFYSFWSTRSPSSTSASHTDCCSFSHDRRRCIRSTSDGCTSDTANAQVSIPILQLNQNLQVHHLALIVQYAHHIICQTCKVIQQENGRQRPLIHTHTHTHTHPIHSSVY